MLTSYVHAAYLLSPNPTIMAHAEDAANRDPGDFLAVDYPFMIQLLPISIVTAEATDKDMRLG